MAKGTQTSKWPSATAASDSGKPVASSSMKKRQAQHDVGDEQWQRDEAQTPRAPPAHRGSASAARAAASPSTVGDQGRNDADLQAVAQRVLHGAVGGQLPHTSGW